MTKSTFPDEWLQPLVIKKIEELNQEAMKDFVTIEKKIFDVLQKNNLDLTDKLERAKKVLRLYADRSHWDDEYTDAFCCLDGWEMAQDCLKEIEK